MNLQHFIFTKDQTCLTKGISSSDKAAGNHRLSIFPSAPRNILAPLSCFFVSKPSTLHFRVTLAARMSLDSSSGLQLYSAKKWPKKARAAKNQIKANIQLILSRGQNWKAFAKWFIFIFRIWLQVTQQGEWIQQDSTRHWGRPV